MALTAQKLRSKVEAVLRKHGHAGTLARFTAGAYNPATSGTAPGTNESWPIFIVSTTEGLSMTVQTSASINQVLGGTLVRNGERLVYFYVDDPAVRPQVGDTLEPVEGVRWRVKRLDTSVSYKDVGLLHRVWLVR